MAPTTSIPSSFEEFEAFVHDAVGTDLAPSVAYGISRGKETLLIGTAGLADREYGIAAAPGTRYALASVTKPLTATLVAMLAERGQIELDGSINAQLGDIKIQSRVGNADEATVRHVADHSSGLAMHFQFYYADEPYPRQGIETAMRHYAKTFTSPGQRQVYSNLGYGILEHLLEHVSGSSLADLMQKELFHPLGMDSSTLGRPEEQVIAKAYGPDGVAYPAYDFDHRGGSAAFSTVNDLLAFGQFHLHHGPELLSREAIDDAHRMSAILGEGVGYGLGWGIRADRHGMRSIHHAGFMGGVSTLIRLIPELDLTVVVLTNGQSQMPFMLSDYLIGTVSQAYRVRLLEPRPEDSKPTPSPVPAHLFGAYSGHIESHDGNIPTDVRLISGDQAIATIGGVEYPLDGLEWQDGRVRAISGGDLRAEDAAVRPYRVHFDLAERADLSLSGPALTMSQGPENSGGAKAIRYGSALAFWTELKRVN